MIFPQYMAEAETEINALTTLETLARITASGYEVRDSYDWQRVKRWIELIESFKKFTITYSDMEDALDQIKRLMNQ